MSAQKNEPNLYVAIGASAGGLEALESFFSNTPDDTGFAFIVVQHLSPDHKSLMVELLSKVTRMKVQRATDSLEVEPNKVYLIPPKKNLTIFHRKLMLNDQVPARGLNFPIDIFFRSLAEDQEEKAVGVILSGTGSDGSQGVRAIKEVGGLVLAQTRDSAKFDGMPGAAIDTGMVDFVLRPSDMVEKLHRVFTHLGDRDADENNDILSDDTGITRIFAMLREKHKVDFTYYKPNTVQRRIQRRMGVNQISSLKEYTNLLKQSPAELATLYRELLIGVTRFFRNKEVYKVLGEEVLPGLLKRNTESEIRFWVAGCSTGEEAYSLAILVKECLEDQKINRDVKIFATDLDRDAIAFAQNGVYSESIAADINHDILNKYFYRTDESFRVSRVIREMVVFAQHNIIKDPPFTNIELVSCRNLLIYLQPVLQKKVLEMFTFSLNQDGVLILGTSETTGELSEYFDHSHQKYRIYTIKSKMSNRSLIFPGTRMPEVNLPVKTRMRDRGEMSFGRMGDELRFVERFMGALVDHYTSVVLVINMHMEVVHVVGETQGLFKLPPGRMTSDISKLAIKDLALPLTTGLQKVFRTKEEIKYSSVPLKREGQVNKFNISIRLLPESRRDEPLALVMLEDVTKKAVNGTKESTNESEYSLSANTEQHIQDLEQELQFTKENLQATIEELETSNEELQATNEELLASNEELQSTNEELQSTNEELHTINAQYQKKIIELTELNNDVENLMTSSSIGKLMLDENLEIRRFSSHILNIFKLLQDDIGRPLTHISHYMKDVDPIELAQLVIKKEQSLEQEIETRSGEWYLMRALPYKIGPEVYAGVVMTFVDITAVKKAQLDLKESEESLRFTSRLTQVANWSYYPDEDKMEVNSQGLDFLEFSTEESETKEVFLNLFDETGKKKLKDLLSQTDTAKEFDFITSCAVCEGQRDIRIIGKPLLEKGKVKRIAGALQDISRVVSQEKQIKDTMRKYHHLFQNMKQGVVYQNREGEIIECNPAACEILGLSRDEMLGRKSRDPRWKSVKEDGSVLEAKDHPSMISIRTGEEVHNGLMGIFNPKTESTRWITVSAFPVFEKEEDDKPAEVYTIFDDVSDRLDSQQIN
jgi:two-component system CheB/CheR fusion protein